jgi:hypothetical protein
VPVGIDDPRQQVILPGGSSREIAGEAKPVGALAESTALFARVIPAPLSGIRIRIEEERHRR